MVSPEYVYVVTCRLDTRKRRFYGAYGSLRDAKKARDVALDAPDVDAVEVVRYNRRTGKPAPLKPLWPQDKMCECCGVVHVNECPR